MKKPKNEATPLGASKGTKRPPNRHRERERKRKKGKFGGPSPSTRATPAVPETIRTQADRIRGRKPAVDGTPNYSEDGQTDAAIPETPITIDAALAAAQLRELAELHLDVRKAEAAYQDKADAAKTAKKTVESKTSFLLERLQAFTHPPSLPLFDPLEQAADQQRLLDADEEARQDADEEARQDADEGHEGLCQP